MSENNIQQKSLSESLDQVEVSISKLGRLSKIQAENILYKLDEIYQRFDELHAQGVSQSGEEAQFAYIGDILKKNTRSFFKNVGGIHRYIELRYKRQPQSEVWWWFLDEYQSKKIKAQQKRSLITGVVIVIVVAVLYAGYQLFLAPDPITQAELTYESNVESLLSAGDYSTALDTANQGLTIATNDPTLVILKAIAQLKMGNATEAKLTFSQAEQMLGNQETLLLDRAITYIRIGDFQSALTDAQDAIKINPQSAEAYFYQATAYQNLGQDSAAYQSFDTASTLAENEGNTQLVATIRINMALLLQQLDVQISTPQTTGTP